MKNLLNLRLVSRTSLGCLSALMWLAGAPAQASVPNASVLEGTLNATGGGAAADGNYAITFAIYKDANDPNALWGEGPVQVAVKNGQFSYVLGSSSPLKPALLNAGAWLSFKIGADPELPRKPVNASVFALRAGIAEGVDCSGCIPAAAINAQALAPFAKKSDLSGVALSGNYADLAGLPNLSAYVKADVLAKVATSGSWADIANKPVIPGVGKSCGTGLVVAGFKSDGTLECVQGGGSGSLPADGIDEISNGLIFNQFIDVFKSTKVPVPIPDNFPLGVGDVIVVPDVGLAQKISVSINLSNSDTSALTVTLFDPAGNTYILHQKGGAKNDGIITTYPDNTPTVSGDLMATWVGKNPKGNWSLQVVDSAFLDNKSDGQVTSWTVNVQTLSNKKIQIKGDLIVDGNLMVSGLNPTAVLPTLRYRVFSTFDQGQDWIASNNAAFFLGVNPSTWTDGNGVAWQINPDKNLWRTFFTGTMKIWPNLNVQAETWRPYSSTNGKLVAVLFRVKNTTQSDVTWTPSYHYTAYADWAERASVTVNGGSNWQFTGNCYSNCTASPSLTIPKNRVSSVIFIIPSGPQSGESRTNTLIFYNNSLKLPAGLQYVDDLDTATGGWEQ